MKTAVMFFLTVSTAVSAQGWLAEHQVTLPSGRTIAFVLPGTLMVDAQVDEEENSVLEVRNDDDSVLMRVTFGEQYGTGLSRPEAQRALLSRLLAPFLEQALERNMRFKSMTTADATGTYCIFSDPVLPRDQRPPAGEWIYVTGGMRAWSTWHVVFRLFSNSLEHPDYLALMAALREGLREN